MSTQSKKLFLRKSDFTALGQCHLHYLSICCCAIKKPLLTIHFKATSSGLDLDGLQQTTEGGCRHNNMKLAIEVQGKCFRHTNFHRSLVGHYRTYRVRSSRSVRLSHVSKFISTVCVYTLLPVLVFRFMLRLAPLRTFLHLHRDVYTLSTF